VGEANDGLSGRVLAPSLGMGIRLGVVGASIGTDVVGEVLRRFEGEDSIGRYGGNVHGYSMFRKRSPTSNCAQSCGEMTPHCSAEGEWWWCLGRVWFEGRDSEGTEGGSSDKPTTENELRELYNDLLK
jgi:hypothetical protein